MLFTYFFPVRGSFVFRLQFMKAPRLMFNAIATVTLKPFRWKLSYQSGAKLWKGNWTSKSKNQVRITWGCHEILTLKLAKSKKTFLTNRSRIASALFGSTNTFHLVTIMVIVLFSVFPAYVTSHPSWYKDSKAEPTFTIWKVSFLEMFL